LCCQPSGSIFIGLICGVAVVFSIEFIDKKLKIDDPVELFLYTVYGALGTLLVGVLLLMADYFTVVDLKTRVQAIEYFQLRHGQWALLYSSFHLEENYGIKSNKRRGN
jgi:ammonia channel protein AmtB